jgi:alkylation response protein AidB-like acyl-CoA dehydrogenase
LQTLDVGSAGALAVGLAQRCLDECVRHIQARYPAHFAPGQTLQFRLADMRIQIEGARQALHRVMALREARLPFSEEAAIAKTLCTDVAMAVTSRAMRLIGSYAYASEFGKFMRDAKVMQISEGTNQIQRLAIARGLLAPPGAAAAP